MEKHTIFDFGKQFAREPVIRRMPAGDILCTFLTGGPTEPHNDNVVMMSRSRDNGHTWSAPETIFSHSRRAVWCTELFTEGDHPFMVILTYNTECHYRELQTYRSYSFDGGNHWEEPVFFTGGLGGVSLRQGIVMSNGEWLFPLYWQEAVGDWDWVKSGVDRFSLNWPFRCGVAISGDRGASFMRYGYIAGERALWEPNCVELEDGHIVMLMRDDACGYLKRSDSMDYGRTWGAPFTTAIPNPNCKPTLLKARGKILLINNYCAEFGKRTNLEIRASEDGLQSFSHAIPLEAPDECFFYPHGFVDESSQKVYIVYENAYVHKLAEIGFSELGL